MNFLTYINCKEPSPRAHLNAAGLIAFTFEDLNGPILDIVLMSTQMFLFTYYEFPELQQQLSEQEENLCADPQKKQPVDVLLHSFLGGKLFLQSAHVIIARFSVKKQSVSVQ